METPNFDTLLEQAIEGAQRCSTGATPSNLPDAREAYGFFVNSLGLLEIGDDDRFVLLTRAAGKIFGDNARVILGCGEADARITLGGVSMRVDVRSPIGLSPV